MFVACFHYVSGCSWLVCWFKYKHLVSALIKETQKSTLIYNRSSSPQRRITCLLLTLANFL